MTPAESSKEGHVIHTINSDKVSGIIFAIVVVAAAGVGILTGFGVSKIQGSSSPTTINEAKNTDKVVGVVDKKRFPDTAEGVMRKGGLEGEGNFHLERAGGESQNVYLTSSVVDLSEFVGKKVKVGGETFEGQKAGWLMDVGYVEVVK